MKETLLMEKKTASDPYFLPMGLEYKRTGSKLTFKETAKCITQMAIIFKETTIYHKNTEKVCIFGQVRNASMKATSEKIF
jgi:hypothetical protein